MPHPPVSAPRADSRAHAGRSQAPCSGGSAACRPSVGHHTAGSVHLHLKTCADPCRLPVSPVPSPVSQLLRSALRLHSGKQGLLSPFLLRQLHVLTAAPAACTSCMPERGCSGEGAPAARARGVPGGGVQARGAVRRQHLRAAAPHGHLRRLEPPGRPARPCLAGRAAGRAAWRRGLLRAPCEAVCPYHHPV